MGDYNVQMVFEIDAPKDLVRSMLTDTDAIATWWSNKVEGAASAPGDEFGVWFPDVPAPFAFTVVTLSEDRIEWRVGEMPPPWRGTKIRFDVAGATDGTATALRFEHRGFDRESEAIAIVTPTWAAILMGLKANVEVGSGEAFFSVS